MSRSYRKNAIIQECYRTKKYWKRQASKKVRRNNCGNGGMYKKLFDSWNISDYRLILVCKDKKSMSK